MKYFTSKKAMERVKTAVIAYQAYHDATQKNNLNGRAVWARMLQDQQDVFAELEMDITGALAFIERFDAGLYEEA